MTVLARSEGSFASVALRQVHPANAPPSRAEAFVQRAITEIGARHRLRTHQRQLLAELVAGCARAEIAARRSLSRDGIKTAIRTLIRALEVRSAQDAVVCVLRRALELASAG